MWWENEDEMWWQQWEKEDNALEMKLALWMWEEVDKNKE